MAGGTRGQMNGRVASSSLNMTSPAGLKKKRDVGKASPACGKGQKAAAGGRVGAASGAGAQQRLGRTL